MTWTNQVHKDGQIKDKSFEEKKQKKSSQKISQKVIPKNSVARDLNFASLSCTPPPPSWVGGGGGVIRVNLPSDARDS